MTTGQVITITISLVAVLVSVLGLFFNVKKAENEDNRDEGVNEGMIMTQLAAIRETLAEIKEEIRESRHERRELRDIVMTLEQRTKALEKVVFKGETK